MPLVAQVTNDTLVTIFKTILDWHLTSKGFPEPCKKLGAGIIVATLDIYSQSMSKLLPTPTKSHYTFNLRDFARVIQVGATARSQHVHHPVRERSWQPGSLPVSAKPLPAQAGAGS